jgi:hypothetical protein
MATTLCGAGMPPRGLGAGFQVVIGCAGMIPAVWVVVFSLCESPISGASWRLPVSARPRIKPAILTLRVRERQQHAGENKEQAQYDRQFTTYNGVCLYRRSSPSAVLNRGRLRNGLSMKSITDKRPRRLRSRTDGYLLRGLARVPVDHDVKCSSDRIIATLLEIVTQALDEHMGVAWLAPDNPRMAGKTSTARRSRSCAPCASWPISWRFILTNRPKLKSTARLLSTKRIVLEPALSRTI